MKRKFLEDLGLEKGAIDKILDANSTDIGKIKGELETVEKENATLKGNLADRDKQLEALKSSTGDVEGMKGQIEKLQADNKAKDEAHAAEIKQMKVDAAVTAALVSAKAKNEKAVRALLELDDVELQEDGTIKGLDKQIKKLTESDDTKFLFNETKQTKIKGAMPGQSGDDDNQVDTSKMTYSELATYMAENPDVKID